MLDVPVTSPPEYSGLYSIFTFISIDEFLYSFCPSAYPEYVIITALLDESVFIT